MRGKSACENMCKYPKLNKPYEYLMNLWVNRGKNKTQQHATSFSSQLGKEGKRCRVLFCFIYGFFQRVGKKDESEFYFYLYSPTSTGSGVELG